MKFRLIFIICFELLGLSVKAQQNTFIDSLLQQTTLLNQGVLAHPETYKLQIIYTQINRDSLNKPHFKTYNYRNNSKDYFYPASTVKLPAVVLALQKLNRFHKKGVTKNTALGIDSSYVGQEKFLVDTTAFNQIPTIAHFIKQILLVSDNEAFNRLFEFIGQKNINKELWRRGLTDVAILRRLSFNYNALANRHTNAFNFYDDKGRLIAHKKAEFNKSQFQFKADSIFQGSGYYKDGVLIKQKMDFSHSNYFALSTQHEFLKRLLFPESYPKKQRFDLNQDDYNFIYKYMSMLPRESDIALYKNDTTYFDGYGKFFLFGDNKQLIPKQIRIFNKVGEAYGYLIDNAYIVDFDKNIEFLLSAVIYVNSDQIFNDDAYDYEAIGFPFLAQLGKVFYDFECKRQKKITPNLERFKFDYNFKK